MRTSYLGVMAAALVIGSPALADMIAASPGVSLTEAAAAHYNHNSRADEQIPMAETGTSGIPAALYAAAGTSPDEGWTLRQVAAVKFDNDGNGQGALTRIGSATTASLAYGEDRDYSQLAMSAGLSPEEAAGMSFDAIANAKLDSEH